MKTKLLLISLLLLITGSVIAYFLIDTEENTTWVKIYPKKRAVWRSGENANRNKPVDDCNVSFHCKSDSPKLVQIQPPPITYKTVPTPYYYVRVRHYSPAEHNEPDRNARGKLLKQGDVACNWLKIGTKVKIYFRNGQIYEGIVKDRVNKEAEKEWFETHDTPLIEFCWANKLSAECMVIDKRCGYYAKIVRIK